MWSTQSFKYELSFISAPDTHDVKHPQTSEKLQNIIFDGRFGNSFPA